MRVKLINSISVHTDLDASTSSRVAALDTGIYQAKPLQDSHLAIDKGDGNLVYLTYTALEEKIYSRDLVLF